VTVISSALDFSGTRRARVPKDLRETLGSLVHRCPNGDTVVRSAPGITTALVGMSTLEHVEDNLQLASVKPLELETIHAAVFGNLNYYPQDYTDYGRLGRDSKQNCVEFGD